MSTATVLDAWKKARGDKPFDTQSLYMMHGSAGMFGFGPSSQKDEDGMMWWSNVPMSSAEEAQIYFSSAAGESALRSKLQELHHGWPEPVSTILSTYPYSIRVTVHDIPHLKHWHKGRVALIGDAAHAVSPNSGQGASMAMEDAMYLFSLILKRQHAVGADDPQLIERIFAGDCLLSEYQRGRQKRCEKIVEDGRRRGQSKKPMGTVMEWTRDFFFKHFLSRLAESTSRETYNYTVDWPSCASTNASSK